MIWTPPSGTGWTGGGFDGWQLETGWTVAVRNRVDDLDTCLWNGVDMGGGGDW